MAAARLNDRRFSEAAAAPNIARLSVEVHLRLSAISSSQPQCSAKRRQRVNFSVQETSSRNLNSLQKPAAAVLCILSNYLEYIRIMACTTSTSTIFGPIHGSIHFYDGERGPLPPTHRASSSPTNGCISRLNENKKYLDSIMLHVPGNSGSLSS